MQSDSGILLNSVRDIFYVVFRHKGAILLFFVLTTAIVTAITFVLPTAYKSEAKLLVRLGRESLPMDPGIEGNVVTMTQGRTGEVKAGIAILTSYEIAESVVQEVGPGWILDNPDLRREVLPIDEPPPPGLLKQVSRALSNGARELLILAQLKERLSPDEEAVKAIVDNLGVEAEPDSIYMTASLMLKTPQVAQYVLNRLLDAYLIKHVEAYTNTALPGFYEARVQEWEEKLATQEAALAEFRARHSISSVAAQTENLLAQIADLEGQLMTVRGEAVGLDAMVQQLRMAMEGQRRVHELSRTTGMPNYAADALKERLIDLRTEEQAMSARYSDSHRPLIELREKIAVVEAMLGREDKTLTEVTTGLNANYEAFEHTYESENANLQAANARIAKLEGELDTLRARHDSMAAIEVEYDRLMREREQLVSEYQERRKEWLQAQIDLAKSVERYSNVSIVQAASPPLAPEKPRKLRNIVLGLLLGLFGGLVFAFVKEYLDDTINTVEAAEKRLGVPVLAEISEREFRSCT